MPKMFSGRNWPRRLMAKIFISHVKGSKIQSSIKKNKTKIEITKDKLEVNFIDAVFSIPPSINSCYRSYNRRVIKSKKYCDWQKKQLLLFNSDARSVKGPLRISVIVYSGKGWRKNRDLDNILKPLLDTLILIGFIEDDNSAIVKAISIEIQHQIPRKDSRLQVLISAF